MSNPNEQQVGGEHYKKYPIQPWDYIIKNSIPWAEGCIIEWVTRWRDKGGIQDLEKAKHMIDKVIAMHQLVADPEAMPLAPHKIMPVYPDVRMRELYEPHCDCERCSAE